MDAELTDLDEYRLLRPLGRGGMGTVYLALDTLLDRHVAVKLISSSDPDSTSRERFLTEARAIARLAHPNVVAIHRVGATRAGLPYLVQELVEGESLAALPRPVAWRTVAELALGIARGVAAAHRSGILHRDLKPANVMRDATGTARILDFGIAKLLTSAAPPAQPAPNERLTADLARPADPDATADAPLANVTVVPLDASALDAPATAAGWLLGTPRYLAPEIWRGGGATVRSDLYAIGVMLYELLAGVAPYGDADLGALRTAMCEADPPALAALTVGTPHWLIAIVERCLARDSTARWESADALAHAIELALAGAPQIPEGNPYRGLRSFDAAHRGVFFGRGADASAVVDRLRAQPLVAVAGDSGVGKSSLLVAGVVPAIIAGALDDRAWRAVVITPGRRPFTTLCDACGLTASDATLPASELVRRLLIDARAGLVLVIDQLEELVTVADAVEAERATQLIAACSDGLPGVRVLLAVRGDFLTRVMELVPLTDLMTRGLYLLRGLSDAQLREAIVGPARVKGVEFESAAMVDALVTAGRGSTGALPLVQFALAELWESRDQDSLVLPATALTRLGGVAGALARHADRVLLGLDRPARDAARSVLLRLVTPEGTRAMRTRIELVVGPLAARALDALVAGRLVVVRDAGPEPTWEIAHEALIGHWTTLRMWLDDRAGDRALRDRIGAAGTAWRRDGRNPDQLWNARQLAVVPPTFELTEGDAEFVAASRRRVRRTRWTRVAGVAVIPLVAIVVALVVRMEVRQRQARQVDARLVAASAARGDADATAAIVALERGTAFAAFDANADSLAEQAWSRARSASRAVAAAYRLAANEIEAALAFDEHRERTRAAMAEVLAAHARFAHAIGDRDMLAELRRRLAAYSAPLAAVWSADARLEVVSGPDVAVELQRFTDRDGKLVLQRIGDPVVGSLHARTPPGSYLVSLLARDGLRIAAPVVLGAGEQKRLEVPLPAAGDVPPGYVYIPAGEFLIGTELDDFFRRDFLAAAPLHAARTAAYLIGRTEVTFGDWIAFLEALEPGERARRRPRTEASEGRSGALERRGAGWELALRPTEVVYRARQGQPIVYPARDRRAAVTWERLPVSGIDLDDARAYAQWLATTGRVPGARLCTEAEWERAARGADGRLFSHGTTVAIDDANLDFTYGKRALAYGPDEVGSHPASDSPFGVADLLGNVWEWVDSERGAMTRGGGWYTGPSSALPTNRDSTHPRMRDLLTGVRVCAAAPAAGTAR